MSASTRPGSVVGTAKTGARKCSKWAEPPSACGNADPAACDGENCEDDERAEHHPGGFVDAVGMGLAFVMLVFTGVRACARQSVRGVCTVRGMGAEIVLVETLGTEEGLEPEPEHVEGGETGGDEADNQSSLLSPGLMEESQAR